MAVELLEKEVSPSLRERQKQQVRKELISSAEHLFEHNGFNAVSVDDIVARAGVAKGTFYLYFKTKGEVVASVIDALVAKLAQNVSQAQVNAPIDASKALITVVSAQLDFFKDYPSMISIILSNGLEQIDLPPEEKARLCERANSVVTAVYERILRKGMLQQNFREIDAQLAARALHAMIGGLVQDAMACGKSLSTVGAAAVELFERGVLYRP